MSSHWPWYLLSVLIWVLTDHDIYCPYWYEFSLTMIFTLRIYMSSHWPWYLLSVFIWVLTDHDIYCPYLYEFSLTMIFTVRIYMSSHLPWYLLSVFIWVLTDHDIYCPYLYGWHLWYCVLFCFGGNESVQFLKRFWNCLCISMVIHWQRGGMGFR
jgi:hypothetical protein